jgi:3-dehydroquinate dehydratase-2
MSKIHLNPKIQVIHGPNLNLLGSRDPSVYGSMTLNGINERLIVAAKENRAELRAFQSNLEGEIINTIHAAKTWADGIIINPGALAAYSYAIADALAATGLPAIEVHISNVQAREEWRHKSVLSPVVAGYIAGFGWRGYIWALQGLLALIEERIGAAIIA